MSAAINGGGHLHGEAAEAKIEGTGREVPVTFRIGGSRPGVVAGGPIGELRVERVRVVRSEDGAFSIFIDLLSEAPYAAR